MRYLLSYNQTPNERYGTVDMNGQARRLIQAYGLAIEGESGGTDFTTGVSDQSFIVKGSLAAVKAVSDALSEQLDREVELKEAC